MALPQLYLSPENYLEIERGNDFKSEYFDGVMVAMAGPSPRHNKIATNLTRHLDVALENSACTTLNSDQMIWAPWGKYLYADVVAFCGKGEFVDGVLINPTVIFEVLSPSTESVDRGVKLSSYRKIESLMHYVLISQDEPRAEVYTKQADPTPWSRDVAVGLEARISLTAVGVELMLADIYRAYLDFPNTERPR
jgi:Uma2 family endonuclease